MKTMKYILVLFLLTGLCACNEWLDVKPRTQKEREDFYSSEAGFKGGLTGCYMKLKNRGIYGEQLTMTYIELLAQLWTPQDETQRVLTNFDWEATTSEGILKTWYSLLYNAITQANDLLDNLGKNGEVIESADRYKMIQGEALAIRAFCHFDLLRLFGQLPEGATIQKSLPYSERIGDKQVKFYDFDTYKEKVLRDYEQAAALLKESDPVIKYSFEQLNDAADAIEKGYIEDDFDAYRRIRFNYWGVKALQARAYLYFGEKAKAYDCAKEIIDAKLPDGSPVIDFSCSEDCNNGYFILPNETLIGLNIFNINDYVPTLFVNSTGNIYYKFSQGWHLISFFFDGQSADYRRANLWNNRANSSGERWTVKKYWQTSSGDGDASVALDMNRQMIPLIRLAEVYLIAIETTLDPGEADQLFEVFKKSRNRDYSKDMTGKDLETELLNEYRRELYAEGQLFFTYKRLGKQGMWDVNSANQVYEREVTEENYLLPIPKTEIEY